MKTILVDDDPSGLAGFEIECGSSPEMELVGKFTSPIAAMEFASHHDVDLALLDIDMPEMDGLTLFDRLKAIRPDMIIVFVTAHAGYAAQVIRKKADYVVFKPYDKEEIEDVVRRAKLLQRGQKKRFYCHTFGGFDLLVDDVPVVFKSSKAKELLALCVFYEGKPVCAADIIDCLWEDYSGSVGECSAFRFTVKQLMDVLKQYHAEALFGREKGICYIHKPYLCCDYFDFLAEEPDAIAAFQGAFLKDYSWAEPKIYELLERKKRFIKKALRCKENVE